MRLNIIGKMLSIVSVGGMLLAAGSALAATDSAAMLERTEKLLDAVENGVLTDLKTEENELRASASTAKSQAMGSAEREAAIRAQDDAMRAKAQELRGKINKWATGGEELIQSLSSDELNEAMAEARGIARYFGLDVEHLSKLYELGKKTIKQNEFVLPNGTPPDKDESYSRYFADFFTFAHNREEELAKYRKEQQEYRITLFKRVTLAYIRALLASTEAVPSCKKTKAEKNYIINGQTVQGFGCRDLVAEKLRAYVEAVQKIASADADRFMAEAEVVIARQELTTDLAAGLPLVGDAMDYYNLYAGEDLAGRCLTRLDKGITTVFAIIPFLPSGWATQAVKRMGMEEHLSSLVVLMVDSYKWGKDTIGGVAVRFGMTPEHFAKVQGAGDWLKQLMISEFSVLPEFPQGKKWLKETAEKYGIEEETLIWVWEGLNKEITLPGGAMDEVLYETQGVISNSAAKEMRESLDSKGVSTRNLEMAQEGQVLLRNMPPEILKKMRERSQKLMDHNLLDIPMNRKALKGNYDEVIAASNMVQEHVMAAFEYAKKVDEVYLVRYVNPTATPELAGGKVLTKGMDTKGKSADWGPQAAFIPVEQKLSKLGNPKAPRPDEIVKFTAKVKECLDAGICKEMHLVRPNGDAAFVWNSPKGDVPVIKRGDQYLHWENGKAIDAKPDDLRPLMVLGEIHPVTGEMVPLTADYDLLAVGSKQDVQMPIMHKTEGMRDEIESKAITGLNEVIEEETGNKGMKLFHHGGENQNPFTPGSFDKDPLITLIDKNGVFSVPTCDYDCMVKWCKSPHSPCGAMPVCAPGSNMVPCVAVDKERLLKDAMHHRRINGYTNLRPNAKWNWGEFNGISGWTPKVLLEDGTYAQYTTRFGMKLVKRPKEPMGLWDNLVHTTMSAFRSESEERSETVNKAAMKAIEMLFSCPGKPVGAAR